MAWAGRRAMLEAASKEVVFYALPTRLRGTSLRQWRWGATHHGGHPQDVGRSWADDCDAA